MKVQSSCSPSSSLRSTFDLYKALNGIILDHDPPNVNTSCYYDSQWYPCPPPQTRTTSPKSSTQFCSSSASSAFSDISTSGDTMPTATSALENEEVTCSATSSSSSYYEDQGQQAAGVKSLIYCPPPPSAYSDQRLYDDEGTGDKMNKNNENKRMRTPPNLGNIDSCTKPFVRCAATTRKSLGQQRSPSSGGRSAKRRKVTLDTVTATTTGDIIECLSCSY
jgi:hypothetical protein